MQVPLFSGGPKDMVPKRRADAIASIVVFVVMTEMVLLQPTPHPILHGEMMRGVVDHVVAEVTADKPSPNWGCEAAETDGQKEIEQCC